jgi:DNA-binding response OmpR family regulator
MSASTSRRPDVQADKEPNVLQVANLEIRLREYQLLADGTRVGLTVREFQTFVVLAQRPDRVVTRPEIYALVWGGQMTYRDRSVDVFVRKVRRKLATCAPNWIYIHTHFGVGYRFSPERVTSV